MFEADESMRKEPNQGTCDWFGGFLKMILIHIIPLFCCFEHDLFAVKKMILNFYQSTQRFKRHDTLWNSSLSKPFDSF